VSARPLKKATPHIVSSTLRSRLSWVPLALLHRRQSTM